MAKLQEVDTIEIQVLVDNELDPITKSQNPAVVDATSFRLNELPPGTRGPAAMEMRMDNICCGVKLTQAQADIPPLTVYVCRHTVYHS